MEKLFIIENYPKFGPRAVATKLDRSESTIIGYAKKNNLKIEDKLDPQLIPDFLVDLDFSTRFDSLTPELVYWIGFFWADGHIGNKYNLNI